MSKISLSGDAAGTGTFTIASPNSNNNRTLTLPDATGTVAVSGSAVTFGALTATTLDVGAGSASTPSLTFTGDTNTGIYSPGADRIGFTEGGTQVGEFDASGNFLFNSGYGSVATAYGCRAWVNFNGTGTVAIRSSANVSSITDNATGSYTMNFTNAMSDTNYAMLTAGNGSTAADPAPTVAPIIVCSNTTQNTGNCTIKNIYGPGGTAFDIAKICVAIFR